MMKLITTNSYFQLFPILAERLSFSSKDVKERNVVFCEAKVSLMVERFICGELGGSFNTDVYSFGKFLRVKKPLKNLLSKEGSSMVVKRILSTSQLKCFKNSKANLAPSLYDLIIQLKSAKVTPEDVELASQETTGVLKNKLQDVGLVYREYERFIFERGLEDQSSMLSYLPSVINDDTDVKGAHVFLVGYSGFTAQAREAVLSIIDKAKDVTAIFTTGKNEQVFVNETARFFEFACKQKGLKLEIERKESQYTEEGKKIVDTLFLPQKKGGEKLDNGRVFYHKAKSPAQEIERIAEVIKSLVEQGKYRYSDVTIALSNVAEYSEYVKNALETLEIPYYIDLPRDVSNHPLITLITSYVDAYRKNLEQKAVVSFFKNPLYSNDKDLTDKLENYIIKYNVNYNKLNKPFTFEQQNMDFNAFEQERKVLSELLSNFNVRVMLNRLGVEQKTAVLSDVLKANGEEEEAAVNEQVYQSVINILDQMDLILGGVKMNLIEFKNVFLSGVSALKLSIIPQYSDAVFVGGYKETALAKARVLFAAGLTSDVPNAKQDVAILSDGDISELEKFKVIVEPKIKVVNHRTRENVALALGAFSERLYLSYPLFDIDGTEKTKSEIFLSLDNCIQPQPFPEREYYLTEKQGLKSFARSCSEFASGAPVDFSVPSAYHKVIGEQKLKPILDRANKEIKERLDKVDRPLISGEISPTALEDYHQCPYRAFVSHSLRVKDREEGKIDALSVGNLMHDIFSVYAKKLNSITDKTTSDAEFDLAKESICEKEEYKKFLESKETSATVAVVLDECKKYCYKTYESFTKSKFKVTQTEASFGSGKHCKYPPVSLLDGKITVKGKIDRIDESEEYYRVIDYKTGSVDDSEKSLFSGVKLQLFLYAKAVENALEEAKSKELAGIYYLPVFDVYEKADEKKKAMAVGFTLSGQDALEEQDSTIITTRKSDFLPVKINKDGKESGTYDKSALEAFVKYAVAVSEQAVSDLLSGVIIASPCKDGCKYCDYNAMCGVENVKERTINKVSEKTFIQAIGEEE